MASALLRPRSVKANILKWFLEGGSARPFCHLAAASSHCCQSTSLAPCAPTEIHQQVPPMLPFGGSMELMAVPKKKVTPYKKGLRNGPKALKPVPVIVRCKSCGRVKLPHFYCCSGDRGKTQPGN